MCLGGKHLRSLKSKKKKDLDNLFFHMIDSALISIVFGNTEEHADLFQIAWLDDVWLQFCVCVCDWIHV